MNEYTHLYRKILIYLILYFGISLLIQCYLIKSCVNWNVSKTMVIKSYLILLTFIFKIQTRNEASLKKKQAFANLSIDRFHVTGDFSKPRWLIYWPKCITITIKKKIIYSLLKDFVIVVVVFSIVFVNLFINNSFFFKEW